MTLVRNIFILMLLWGPFMWAQQPKVLSTFPLNLSENLSCNTPIFFTIDYSIEGASLRMESFREPNIKLSLKGKSKKTIPSKLSYDPFIQKVLVEPMELLEPNTSYVLSVSKKLRDDRGQAFLPYKLEFKTGDCHANAGAKTAEVLPEPEPVELSPIKVTDFKAVSMKDSVRISWHATESLLTEGYFLEKSEDGELFTFLGSIPALGGLEEDHFYVFHDPYPSTGESFYRLGSKHSLDEARFLDTLSFFESGVQFLDRRIQEGEELPLLFYNKKATSMVFVLKDPASGNVVFRQAKLLPAGKTRLKLPLTNVGEGLYIALIQTTEIAVKAKIQIN